MKHISCFQFYCTYSEVEINTMIPIFIQLWPRQQAFIASNSTTKFEDILNDIELFLKASLNLRYLTMVKISFVLRLKCHTVCIFDRKGQNIKYSRPSCV